MIFAVPTPLAVALSQTEALRSGPDRVELRWRHPLA
jgi:hypothetical protein